MKQCALVFPMQGKSIFLGIKKQKYGAGLYNGWGGKHKQGDIMLEATALREFREETGGATFEIRDLEEVAVVYFHQGVELVFECHVYFLYAWKGVLSDTPEMGRGRPFPCNDLPFDEMMAGDAKWLPLVCDEGQKNVLRIEMFYDESMQHVRHWAYRPLRQKAAR